MVVSYIINININNIHLVCLYTCEPNYFVPNNLYIIIHICFHFLEKTINHSPLNNVHLNITTKDKQ